jgi:hypothetical protein
VRRLGLGADLSHQNDMDCMTCERHVLGIVTIEVGRRFRFIVHIFILIRGHDMSKCAGECVGPVQIMT